MWGTILLVSLFYLVYLWMKKKHNYWAQKGVLFEKPLPIFGNMFPVYTVQKSLGDQLDEIYKKYPNEEMVGFYEMTIPTLIVRDLGLIERILVKDFSYFADHPHFGNTDGTFATGLFNLKGSIWRSVRYKISPSFTSGKLKAMFPQMLDCSKEVMNIIKRKTGPISVKNIVNEIALDVIATCIFGIEIKDSKARKQFIDMSNHLFYGSNWRFVKQHIFSTFPEICQRLGVRFFPKNADDYLYGLIKATFKQRESSKSERNDFIQYLIELKKKGTITLHTNEKDQEDNYLDSDEMPIESIEITDEILSGQAAQFLLGGFDPVLNATTYVLYQLSQNEDVQEKVRKEIKEKLEKHGSYNYAALKEMTYLEQCVLESLRIHPLAQFLMRVCTKTYTAPNGVVIEKGTKIYIPTFALHMDPQYFDEPTKFNPDKFASNSQPTGYSAFGNGPRICIGMRFAIVEVKLLVARITENFTYILNPKTDNPLRYNKAPFPVPESEVFLDFNSVNK